MEPFAKTSNLDTWQGKLLIAGMSRSGTSWLMRVMNMHPHVASFGESMFWSREYIEPESDGHYGYDQIQEIGHRYATNFEWGPSGDLPGSLQCCNDETIFDCIKQEFATVTPDSRMTPFEVFRLLCATVAKAEGKVLGVEKTPHHVMWQDRISGSCSDYRMVVTIRNPYDFMLSYKHQGDRKDPATRLRFQRRYHPFACALVWRRYAEKAAEARQTNPEQVLLLDFATFRNDEDASLRQVQDFFQLEWHDIAGSIPQANSSFPKRQRPELKPEDVFWINLIAGHQIAALDYERRSTPFALWRISYSLLRLSWWGVWNFFDLRRIVSGSYWQFLRRWFWGN